MYAHTHTHIVKGVTYKLSYLGLQHGPLKGEYQIVQFHFHWGRTDATGSEHRLNGKMFASEVKYI